ncbi:Axin, partial [Pseudolycoriella hygida]
MNRAARPKHIDEYECSGPRPPVPGQESRLSKMTEGAFERNPLRTSLASYSKWNTLQGLLEDAEGLKLFKKYVERDAKVEDSARLDFYIICEGLKLYQDEGQARSCILAIYNKYIHKNRIQISVSNTDSNFKQKFNAIKSNKHAPDIHIFDLLQQEAFRLLNETAFQNFLQSDDYLDYVANVSGNQAVGTETLSSSESCSEQLTRSALPTVVEDQELSIHGEDRMPVGDGVPQRLTKELLWMSQRRRLEVRQPATHGYSVYNTCASFNPVSRQDSERQSCSSGGGGKSDSETMSVSSSRDGRSHAQRRQNSIECKAMQHMNKNTLEDAVVPRTERVPIHAVNKLTTEQFVAELRAKLEKLHRERHNQELMQQLNLTDPSDNSSRLPPMPSNNQSNFHGQVVADLKRFQLEEDNDQSILDQHVSRVWSDLTPHISPGTISPCPPVPSRRRAHDPITTGTDAGQSMRHSKSMPEHASSSKRLTHKWSSMNTDSGISLFSTDTTLRSRDLNSRSRSMGIDSVISTVEEASRRLEDESRRSRRQSQHPIQSQQTLTPAMRT